MSDTRKGWDTPTAWDAFASAAMALSADKETCALAHALVRHVETLEGQSRKELLDAAREFSALASRTLDRAGAEMALMRDGGSLGCFERALRTKPTPKSFKEIGQ